MTGEVLKRVLDEKRAAKRREEAAARERMNAALSLPDVAEAHREYINILHESLRYGGADRAERAELAHAAYVDALRAAGWSEEDFLPRISCEKCEDTGICDGRICDCVKKAFVRALGVACDISPKGFALSDFSADAVKGPQAERLASVYAKMRAYAKKFPDVNRNIIVCTGKTGTGKTMLAEALARTLIRRGHSAVMMSAVAFNSLMLKCHTSPYSEREGLLADVMSAELLVIDDLGTEPRYNNVTCEYLLMVIEERTSKGLSTMITTNLSPDRILRTYNERIYSRLFDKRRSVTLLFEGEDLRLN